MLLQGRPMEPGLGNDLGQDILKILYAAEDEKVEVSASGELTITAPNGEQVQGEIANAGAADEQMQEGTADADVNADADLVNDME